MGAKVLDNWLCEVQFGFTECIESEENVKVVLEDFVHRLIIERVEHQQNALR